MKNSLKKHYLKSYPCSFANKIQATISDEDRELLYKVFSAEGGAASFIATLLLKVFIDTLRKEGVTNYGERLGSNNFESMDTVVANIIKSGCFADKQE